MFITALFLTNIARTYEKEGSYEIIKNRTGKRVSCYVDSCKGEVTLRSVDGDIFESEEQTFPIYCHCCFAWSAW